MTDADVQSSLLMLKAELERRRSAELGHAAASAANDAAAAATTANDTSLPPVLYAHKSTYATSDPEAASAFAKQYLGAVLTQPNRHACGDITTARWPAANEGEELHMHFVFNPHKAPGGATFNATDLATQVAQLRGKTFSHDTFDQFMDTHVGLVVDKLDPFVERWKANNIPYICRSWCCGPGMRLYEEGKCPSYSFNRTSGCETGCYVQIPGTGFVVEMQCGLDSYEASRSCLTLAEPETFDLCTDK